MSKISLSSLWLLFLILLFSLNDGILIIRQNILLVTAEAVEKEQHHQVEAASDGDDAEGGTRSIGGTSTSTTTASSGSEVLLLSPENNNGETSSLLSSSVCDASKSINPAAAEEVVVERVMTEDDDDDPSLLSLPCKDLHESCNYWASIGECTANSNYMNKFCIKSCNQKCNNNNNDHQSSSSSSIRKNEYYEEEEEEDDLSDFGLPQVLQAPERNIKYENLHELIKTTRYYMKTNPTSIKLSKLCTNNDSMCTIWGYMGECAANPKYMKLHCAPVCQSCEYTTLEGRCGPIPNDISKHNVWKSNDLHLMFERIISNAETTETSTKSNNEINKYNVTILSSPTNTNNNNGNNGGPPWVITIDDFLTTSESQQLIELGSIEGYQRSLGVGKTKLNGETDEVIDEGRTSSTAWCMDDCYRNETAMAVMDRISKLTNIDEMNAEYLQLLKYEVNQKYDVHHDYIPVDRDRQQGVRILTVYLYLNDVEAGGGTNFPSLNNLTVMPKRGRALIWPSVTNNDPQFSDRRMKHQALKVEAGIKYGANAWFHIRDFKTPNANGCQ